MVTSEVLRSVLVSRDPERMSGAVVFHGTRVPVESLVDWLQAGDSIDDYLESFPTVGREQVIAALEILRESLLKS